MQAAVKRFGMAPMSGAIQVVTVGLSVLLAGLAAVMVWRAFVGDGWEAYVGIGVVVLTLLVLGWVWFGMRPGSFEVTPNGVEIVRPLSRIRLPLEGISGVRRLEEEAMKGAVRIFGAGGFGGGFGWFWSRRLGRFRAYVSRTKNLVIIELRGDRPVVLSPDEPEAFVSALEARLSQA